MCSPMPGERSARVTRVLLLAALAGCCATVLYSRVYWRFERVRIKVVTTDRPACGGVVTSTLPDMSRLAGYPAAIVLRLENDERAARTVTVTLNGSDIGRFVLEPERTVRIDLGLPASVTMSRGDRFEVRSDGDGWSLHFLEIANIHGFSDRWVSLVIVPADTNRYDAVSASAALAAFGALFGASLAFGRFSGNRTARFIQVAVCGIVVMLFVTTLMLTTASTFKVLLSAHTFWLCLAALYSPVLIDIFARTRPGLGRLSRWAILTSLGSYLVAARVKALYVAAVGLFLLSVLGFYEPATGFTSLINFGVQFQEDALPALRAVPHYVDDSPGYDGQFYAQLALEPLARDPAIERAVDNFAYRARRILFSWTAFALGLGRPRWILQAYAVQNIVCWMALACLLRRWLPPVDLRNFALWFGCLFSHGLAYSVRGSLLEGPSLLLLAVTVVAVESKRPWVASGLIGLAGLGRETNLLSGASVPWCEQRSSSVPVVAVSVARALMIGLPLALWVIYLRHGHQDIAFDTGTTNFAWPLSAYAMKWSTTISSLSREGWESWARFEFQALVSLTTQALVLSRRVDWRSPWWRVGIAYAILMLFLGPAVWEGVPGAVTRLLLPMTCAFNILLRRDRWFWPLAVLGNLTVLNGLETLRVPLLWAYL